MLALLLLLLALLWLMQLVLLARDWDQLLILHLVEQHKEPSGPLQLLVLPAGVSPVRPGLQ
jgi:hypothetical protein